jgi:hypothetical protein
MEKSPNEIAELSRMVARVQAGVLALVFALVSGIGLFIMTAFLLIKGGSNVGYHLRLLGQYFPGYSVTWVGSLIGLLYGAIVGAIVGWSIGKIYNWIARLRQR